MFMIAWNHCLHGQTLMTISRTLVQVIGPPGSISVMFNLNLGKPLWNQMQWRISICVSQMQNHVQPGSWPGVDSHDEVNIIMRIKNLVEQPEAVKTLAL
jgi:hypothetical protein